MAFWFCSLSAEALPLYLALPCFIGIIVIGEDSDFAPVPSVRYWGFLWLCCHCIILAPVWPVYSQMFAIISVLSEDAYMNCSCLPWALRAARLTEMEQLLGTTDDTSIYPLTQGYSLQFQHWPPASGWVKMTITADPAKSFALSQELSTHLTKGVIMSTYPLHQPQGSIQLIFWWQRKKVDFDQSWTWGDSTAFWRPCHSTCWASQMFCV